MRMYSTEFGVVKSGVLDLVSFDSRLTTAARMPSKTNDCSPTDETVANNHSQKVVVVVYKTSLEHFAVVYPHWGLISAKRPFCIINLKRARVERSNKDPERQFSIRSYRESDLSTILCFTPILSDKSSGNTNSIESIQSWINALQAEVNEFDTNCRQQWKWSAKRRVSKSTLLSVLNEDDSEEYGI